MSRPDAPQGGLTDQVIDLRDAGYASTSELSRLLNIGGPIPGTWIINNLGIKPKVSIRNGAAMYWAPEQVREIRRALILRLLADEFGANR